MNSLPAPSPRGGTLGLSDGAAGPGSPLALTPRARVCFDDSCASPRSDVSDQQNGAARAAARAGASSRQDAAHSRQVRRLQQTESMRMRLDRAVQPGDSKFRAVWDRCGTR